ncbi:hypothetical protein QBC37DRAFT_392965 [Rhypophila decipiens]|uniref:Uncharacterized protein n=1 Tax=Rhypophila decipiens TaxID=261697 RepID=A0AAN6XUM1_9PEZI|nr:hypothetical protein QBC37DRAFT_392965 [Rhypophila decipiens]
MPGFSRISLTVALMLAAFQVTITRAAMIRNFYNRRTCTGPSYACLNVLPRECCGRQHEEIVSTEFINLPDDSFANIHRSDNPANPTVCHGDTLDSANGPNVCMWRPTYSYNRGNGKGKGNTVREYHGGNYELHANVILDPGTPPPPLPALPGIAGLAAVGSGPARRRDSMTDRREHHALMTRGKQFQWNDTQFWEGWKILDDGVTRGFDLKDYMCPAPNQEFKPPCKPRKPDLITFADGHQFKITDAPDSDVDKLFALWKKQTQFADIPKELKKYEDDPDKVTFRLQDWKRTEVEKPLQEMSDDEKEEEAKKDWVIRGPEFQTVKEGKEGKKKD